jgi:3-deoxy-D-manno-octulosonic-acid transferase
MAIFVKYEFWPAYLRELKKRDIPTYSISAIFRPTQRFFHWYGKGSLSLLHCFTHIFVQDEASRRLLAEHGVHDCSVAGDTRFDRVNEVLAATRERPDERLLPVAQFVENAPHVVVAGSTWPEDEELLMKWCNEVAMLPNDTKLILVPHEINKDHLHDIFQRFKGRFVKYSDINCMPSNLSRVNILQRANVMVIDTIGLLSSIYQFGHVAYIGGGFGEGIHNTLEAAVYGMPVVFGPNYHHFREAQGLIDAGAARSIKDYPELEAAFATALERHEEIGRRAAEYVTSELGATAKIYKELF